MPELLSDRGVAPLNPTNLKTVTITTDGACHPNPGNGGWAAILRYGAASKEISGAEGSTTNNKMEFRAIIEALRRLREPVNIILRSDSKVALAWAGGHSFGKEKTRLKNPVVWGMIQEYRELAAKHSVVFEWVRGHNGDPDNERCDCLAEDQSRRPF